MEIKFDVKLPPYWGITVDELYNKGYKENELIKGWTIKDNLTLIECEGKIATNGYWNYHNNYDNSEDVLWVGNEQRWFTTNKELALEIQNSNIEMYSTLLKKELERLNKLKQTK